jgi:hypothetical protein
MNSVLVDSSVWIDYFKGNNPKSNILSDLIDKNAVCTNDLILAELIPYIKISGETHLVELLFYLTNIKLNIDWDDIMKMQTLNLKNNLYKIGIPDLIILQNVIQNNLILFSFDNHFKAMSNFHKFKFYEK